MPFPYAADDHQTKNADAFANAGAAKLVQEAQLDGDSLARLVTEILNNYDIHSSMKKAAAALDVPDAAARVCQNMQAAMKK